MLAELFKRRNMKSLDDFALFYDDFNEYGDRDAQTAFYFVPGIGGVPGQVRFALPSLQRVFGTRIYVRCLHLDAFSASRPIWEKFTRVNVDKKRDQIVTDLVQLGSRHETIHVIASSNGFYDFLYAYRDLDTALVAKLKLIWVAVAPDSFLPNPWEAIFYRLNGFEHNGYRWFALPNHNLLRWINPETTTSHTWRRDGKLKRFFKDDLEFRMSLLGVQWGYASRDAFNDCLEHAIRQTVFPLDLRAFILVATNDGYWQGRPPSDVDNLLDRYLSNKTVFYKHASHLWVLVPDNLDELLQTVERDQ